MNIDGLKRFWKRAKALWTVLSKTWMFAFNVWVTTFNFITGLITFLIVNFPLIVIILIIIIILLLMMLLVTMIYYTQLMPIMSIKVNIDDHWILNYVYSSDLSAIKWKATANEKDNIWAWNLKDAEILQKWSDALKDVNLKTDSSVVWVITNSLANIGSFFASNKKDAVPIATLLHQCIVNQKLKFSQNWDDVKSIQWKSSQEFIYENCIFATANSNDTFREWDEGQNKAILKQAEMNAYTIFQLKWIGLNYVKDFSNFCSSTNNILKNAENGIPLDQVDVKTVENYLNTTYMLGRDAITWLANKTNIWKDSPLFFLLQIHLLARKYFPSANREEVQMPFTERLLRDSIDNNYFVSRLWESYFFPSPTSKDSFIAYEDETIKWESLLSVPLKLNSGIKITDWQLFEKDVYKSNQDKEKQKTELTPELKNLKAFYDSSCSTDKQEWFVRMNFVNTNWFALNKNGFTNVFTNRKDWKDNLWQAYLKTYSGYIKNYWDKLSNSNVSNNINSYNFFNQTLQSRLIETNSKSWAIKWLYNNYKLFFFNNFLINNLSINSTESVRNLWQIVSPDKKFKLNILEEQLNQIWEVQEYDQIVNTLHKMYFLKGTISGKYYVMDYSPLDNIYKADPVYWFVTVMNPFPIYPTEVEIQESEITNQDFFKKINGIAINRKYSKEEDITNFFNIPYVNIDITDIAIKLWYKWTENIKAKYYLYGINQDDKYFKEVIKNYSNIKLKHNQSPHDAWEYYAVGNWLTWNQTYEKVFKANPFIYSSIGWTDLDKFFYKALWYDQMKVDINKWIDELTATYNGFWDDAQLKQKFNIPSNWWQEENIQRVKEKNNKLQISESWNQQTTDSVYDWTPKKLTFCIKNPITIEWKVPVVNYNLYGLLQDKAFNFFIPTTYKTTKFYNVCMDIDNVYVKKSDYLNILRWNTTLSNKFKIMWKGNMVFTSLYLKDYVPNINEWIVAKAQLETLKEMNLIRKLEKKQTKMLNIISAWDTNVLPFCQIDIKNKTKLMLEWNLYRVFESATPFSITIWDWEIVPLRTTLRNHNTKRNVRAWVFQIDKELPNGKLQREYTTNTIFAEWTPKYESRVLEPLKKEYKDKVSKLWNIFATDTTKLWYDERLGRRDGNRDNTYFDVHNTYFDTDNNNKKQFTYICKDQFWQEKNSEDLEQQSSYDTSQIKTNYLTPSELASFKKWESDIYVDYGEFFYNPFISFYPITDTPNYSSQLFKTVKFDTKSNIETYKTMANKKAFERFIHLVHWLGGGYLFEAKWNKYFDYIDNLLWNSWGSRYNLIFAHWNKNYLQKAEDMRVINQIQDKHIKEMFKNVNSNNKKLISLLYWEFLTSTWEDESEFWRILQFFEDKIKNFAYSYIIDSTIQPTYYDYFWSSSSNDLILGSSLNFFTSIAKYGISDVMYPTFRFAYIREFFLANKYKEKGQQSLAAVNTNHYFNNVFGKYFSNQQKHMMWYSDIYSPYQKFSKVFWKEDLLDFEYPFFDGKKAKIKEKHIKNNPTLYMLANLSLYGNNFYMLGDFIDSVNTWGKYPYQQYRIKDWFKNFNLSKERLEEIVEVLNDFGQDTDNWFTNVASSISSFLGLSEAPNPAKRASEYIKSLIIEQMNFVSQIRDKIIEISSNDNLSDEEKEHKILELKTEEAIRHTRLARLLSTILWIEDWLSPYVELQTNSLQEGNYALTKDTDKNAYLNNFYNVFYDENKMQEKMLNYVQNKEIKERYDEVYSKVLEEAAEPLDKQQYLSISYQVINHNRGKHNQMKDSYLRTLEQDNYSNNWNYFWKIWELSKDKANYEADKNNENLELEYRKHLSQKTIYQQYLSMIGNNLYINPIISLFKKVPEKSDKMSLTSSTKELAKLEKAFNSFVIFSNLWNDIKNSPIFEIQEDSEELVKPFNKLFNPNYSYVLQNLVDKSVTNMSFANSSWEVKHNFGLSHNFISVWESFGKLWALNGISLMKSAKLSLGFSDLFNEKKAFFREWHQNMTIFKNFIDREVNLYNLLRAYLPHYMILPREVNSQWGIQERINWVSDYFAKFTEKINEKYQDEKLRYSDFTEVKDGLYSLMWDLRILDNYPTFNDKELETLWAWDTMSKYNIWKILKTNFYKKQIWIDTQYYYSPSKIFLETWKNAYIFFAPVMKDLWWLLSEEQQQKWLLSKNLINPTEKNKISQWWRIMWNIIETIGNTQLPSQWMRDLMKWVNEVDELLNKWGKSGKFSLVNHIYWSYSSDMSWYKLFVEQGFAHIPLYQHKYLSALLKLRLQNATTDSSTLYKIGTDNKFSVIEDKLVKKTYIWELADEIAQLNNTNNNFLLNSVGISQDMQNLLGKTFTKYLSKSKVENYVNAVVTYELWKTQLLQDANALWKEYNSKVEQPSSSSTSIFRKAYPEAFEWTDRKWAIEEVIESTLDYYEKQAYKNLMSVWGGYIMQKNNFKFWWEEKSLGSYLKDLWRYLVNDLKGGVSNLEIISKFITGTKNTSKWWVTQPFNSYWNLQSRVETVFDMNTLWNTIKAKGFWFFGFEDRIQTDPKHLYAMLNSEKLKTSFYTYLLFIREILDDKFYTLQKKDNELARYNLLYNLGYIDRFEELALIYKKQNQTLSSEDIKNIQAYFGNATLTTQEQIYSYVEKRVKEKIEHQAKLIDWMLMVVSMEGNYVSSSLSENVTFEDSNLWLKDYSKILWEPQAIVDYMLYLYWLDSLKVWETFTGTTLQEVRKEIESSSNINDIGSSAYLKLHKKWEVPVIEDKYAEINQEDISWEMKKYVYKKLPFITYLAFHSLYTYDDLDIAYNTYYKNYIRENNKKTWWFQLDTILWQEKWGLWKRVGNVFSWIGSFIVNRKANNYWNSYWGIKPLSWFTYDDAAEWVKLNKLSEIFETYNDYTELVFAQGWRFVEDFKNKDIWILLEQIKLNDYIKWLYTNSTGKNYLEGLRESVDITQLNEKVIENSYTIWENLQVDNFAILNYILSQKKYLNTHFFVGNTLDKFTERNKLNVIAFNYFSYQDDKWAIGNVRNILSALKSGWFVDGVDTSKTDWEWFVWGLKYIECKNWSECARIINSVAKLDGWVAFEDFIQKEIKAIEEKNPDEKKQSDEIKHTIKSLNELVNKIAWWKLNLDGYDSKKAQNIPAWEIVWFWENQKASCKQKFTDVGSSEFKDCMVKAIMDSEVSLAANGWKKSHAWQCTWGSNIMKSWMVPELKSINVQGNWMSHSLYWWQWKYFSIPTANYSVKWVSWYGNDVNNKVRFCYFSRKDYKNVKPNMIYSTNYWNGVWHVWYVSNVYNCTSYDSCIVERLETNTVGRDKFNDKVVVSNTWNYPWISWQKFNWWAYEWTSAFLHRLDFKLSQKKLNAPWSHDWLHYHTFNAWFADLDKPYNLNMVKQSEGSATEQDIINFCNDYNSKIVQFK